MFKGKQPIEPWIVASQRKRLRKQLGRLTPRQALNLQALNISEQQISMAPESQFYPKFGKELGKAAQSFKRRGLVSYQKMFYEKGKDAYAIIGLKITEKGMKALSKAGGRVFLPIPKERR
jgi:hypothetical protein